MTIDRRTIVAGGLAAGAASILPAWTFAPALAGAPMANAQAPGFYRYKLGDYQITTINDGYFTRPLEGFVRNAKIEDVQKAMAAAFLPTTSAPFSFNTTVINTGSKLILIDVGNGNSGVPTAGSWMANFRAAGFTPEQVDTIIISHFHGDHINGLRLKDGTAVFPNAEIKVPQPESAFWMDDARMNSASDALKGAFQNVRRVFADNKNVDRFEWGKDVMPGIAAVQAEGHSPGHTAFVVSSGSGKLMVMGDVSVHPVMSIKHPDWQPVFDMNGDIAVRTRKKLFDMAATEKTQVVFYHAPFPSTGHLIKSGSGYELVPIAWTSGV